MTTSSDNDEQVPMSGGKVLSSHIPRWELIPTVAIDCLADRFAAGIERKGDKSWNAIATNQDAIMYKKFLLDRCAHIARHAMLLRDKLLLGDIDPSDDDDAGAILFGGALMACATRRMLDGEPLIETPPE